MNRRVIGAAVALGLVAAVQPLPVSADADGDGGLRLGGGKHTLRAAAAGVTQNMPVAIWQLPAGTYDGIGSWMIPGNVPAAGAGQVQPVYFAVHEFNFVNHTDADAYLAVGIIGSERFVEFAVFFEGGRETRAYLPFNWQANRWYFPFVYRGGNGMWAAFVYDLTAAASTYVGSLVVPTDWAGIDPQSYLYVGWGGPDPETCSGYPQFDVYRLSPTGFIGQVASQSTLPVTDVNPGDCSGTLAGQPNAAWSHFVMG